MKKTFFNLFLAFGVAAALASCADESTVMNEEPAAPAVGKTVTFAITSEDGVRAKAPAKGAPARVKGDGSGATQLRYCFYDADTKEPLIYTGQDGAPEAEKTDDGFKLTVSLDPQKKYYPVFMASASFAEVGRIPGNWITTFNPAKANYEVFQNKVYLSADGSYDDHNINDENYNKTEMFLYRDFTKVVDINKADCPTSFTLTRPYAEIVLLASEATINASAEYLNKVNGEILLRGAGDKYWIDSVLNLLTGEIDGDGANEDYICWNEYAYYLPKNTPMESFGGTGDYADYKVLYRGFVLCGARSGEDNNLCFTSIGFGGNPTLEAPLKFSELKANTRYIFITGGTGSSSNGSELLGGTDKSLSIKISSDMNNGSSSNI